MFFRIEQATIRGKGQSHGPLSVSHKLRLDVERVILAAAGRGDHQQ